ncbi:MAG: hypothetical protein DCC67_00075 [Planctomycetota bacterium]|nr:MAG: hypothetical protein DCC67_00075 [Planctomycetota bacterium]
MFHFMTNRPLRVVPLLVVAALCLHGDSARGDYAAAVTALNPTHYYRLDETSIGTVINTGSSGLNGTHEGLGVGAPNTEPQVGDLLGYAGSAGPDAVYKWDGANLTTIPLPGFNAGNKSLFTNNALAVNLGAPFGPGGENRFAHTTMTVAAWFKVPADPFAPAESEVQFGVSSGGGERLFTNNFEGEDLPGSSALDTSDVDDRGHFQIDLGAGANLVVSLDNRFADPLKSNFQIPHRDNHPGPFGPAGPGSGFAVKDNSWHHIVVSRNGDDINDVILVIDGEHITTDRYADSTDSWGITAPFDARIGTRTTAPHDHTWNGWIDEMALWIGRQLTVQEAVGLWNAATGQTPSADFDADSDVDGNDLLVWQRGFPATYDAADLAAWKSAFGASATAAAGAVPEPASAGLALACAAALVQAARTRRTARQDA